MSLIGCRHVRSAQRQPELREVLSMDSTRRLAVFVSFCGRGSFGPPFPSAGEPARWDRPKLWFAGTRYGESDADQDAA